MEPRKSLVLLLVSASLLISCAATKASDASYFNPTIYYKPTIRADHLKCPVEDLVEMHSPEDKVLATICKADFARCVMQGSCFVVEKNRT
ncbi:MAG TPA: hypothetical protein VN132_02660, partial [Bdellovibrio sp.]|nr:hypothetical protein [Bdellovibrio sp.]